MRWIPLSLLLGLLGCPSDDDTNGGGSSTGGTGSETSAGSAPGSTSVAATSAGSGDGSSGAPATSGSTTAPATTDASTTGGSGGSTGAPVVDGAYDPCADAMDCPDGLTCNLNLGHCTVECAGDGDCPEPATGDAIPTCGNFSMVCILSCVEGLTCPDGMICDSVGPGNNGIELCQYP